MNNKVIDILKEKPIIIPKVLFKNYKKLNITKTIDTLGGIICEFELQKPAVLEKRLMAICNAYKVKAEPGAIKFLIETSGTSMQELINEIRKLIEYARRRRHNKKKRH